MTVTILSPTRYCTNQAIEHMISKYCPKDNVTILDVGCGKGNYSQFFSSQQIEGSYLGIDIEKHESWQSREETNTQIDYLVYNAEELQDFDRKFDFIISVQSLEHIMNDTVAVKGMTTCLNDGGHITLTVPSKYYFLLYPKHGYRGYKLADIKRLATENGLHIEEIIKIGGLTNIILHFVLWTIPAAFGIEIWKSYKKSRLILGLINRLESLSFHIDKLLRLLESGYAIVLKKQS